MNDASARPRFDSTLADCTVRVVYDGDPVLAAGSLTRFDVNVEAALALPPGAEIGLARRWPSDWGIPQWRDPAAPNYMQITDATGRPHRWWNARMHAWHPFDHVLFVALPDGLAPGETLRVRFGAADGGSPGFIAQSFIEEGSPLSVRLRAAPDAPWAELARPAV